MELNVYYDKDADLGRLDGKTVAVIGYGSQGHAHALNLDSSGVSVVVGLRKESPSRTKAEEAGLRVLTPEEAARQGDVVMLMAKAQKGHPRYRVSRRDHHSQDILVKLLRLLEIPDV